MNLACARRAHTVTRTTCVVRAFSGSFWNKHNNDNKDKDGIPIVNPEVIPPPKFGSQYNRQREEQRKAEDHMRTKGGGAASLFSFGGFLGATKAELLQRGRLMLLFFLYALGLAGVGYALLAMMGGVRQLQDRMFGPPEVVVEVHEVEATDSEAPEQVVRSSIAGQGGVRGYEEVLARQGLLPAMPAGAAVAPAAVMDAGAEASSMAAAAESGSIVSGSGAVMEVSAETREWDQMMRSYEARKGDIDWSGPRVVVFVLVLASCGFFLKVKPR